MFVFKLAVIIIIILKYDRDEPLKHHAVLVLIKFTKIIENNSNR